jgi:putative (di)nucleoside polyphosphate hydrolase
MQKGAYSPGFCVVASNLPGLRVGRRVEPFAESWQSRRQWIFEGVRIVIDPDGYRPNVGIVLMRQDGRVFWARRVRRDGWQFPQGGMNTDETPVEAMYRELREETGLLPEHVEVLGTTPGWLRYRLPERAIRRSEHLVCIGQKQVWFLLRMVCDEDRLCLDATEAPEFDHWCWVDFWYPLEHVVLFKRSVYARALSHLAPMAASIAVIQVMPVWLQRELRQGLEHQQRRRYLPQRQQPVP